MSRHDEKVRLRHMFDAAREAVALTAEKSRADLDAERLLQLGLTRLLEVIGEAASRIPPETRQRFPGIPWASARAHSKATTPPRGITFTSFYPNFVYRPRLGVHIGIDLAPLANWVAERIFHDDWNRIPARSSLDRLALQEAPS
jgi:hypothetical protein